MVNVEKIVIDYISSKTTYNVAAEISNPRTEDVTLEITGGDNNVLTTIKKVSLAIQFWGNSRLDAAKKAYNVSNVLENIADEVKEVCKAELGVPYNWTDREPRYQMTLDLTIV